MDVFVSNMTPFVAESLITALCVLRSDGLFRGRLPGSSSAGVNVKLRIRISSSLIFQLHLLVFNKINHWCEKVS